MSETKSTPSLESTLKSLDTEEFIDIHFYRPIGYQWALFFNKLGVSPNSITIASIFIGIAAGICFYFQSLAINVIGMLLLIWANSYDSADGQLARMTGQKSALGRILDGAAGDFWFIAIYAAICLRLTPEWGIWIWLLAATTGFFHSKQAAMADYYRNIHLLFLKGKSGSELSHSPQLNYTIGQEAWTPKFQHMMNIIREKYNGQAPEWFRKAFRTKSLPLMKYTNMLSFNTRVIALFVSLFIDMPWLYFVFELTVLNSMLLYMIKKHEHICEDFSKQL